MVYPHYGASPTGVGHLEVKVEKEQGGRKEMQDAEGPS